MILSSHVLKESIEKTMYKLNHHAKYKARFQNECSSNSINRRVFFPGIFRAQRTKRRIILVKYSRKSVPRFIVRALVKKEEGARKKAIANADVRRDCADSLFRSICRK